MDNLPNGYKIKSSKSGVHWVEGRYGIAVEYGYDVNNIVDLATKRILEYNRCVQEGVHVKIPRWFIPIERGACVK